MTFCIVLPVSFIPPDANSAEKLDLSIYRVGFRCKVWTPFTLLVSIGWNQKRCLINSPLPDYGEPLSLRCGVACLPIIHHYIDTASLHKTLHFFYHYSVPNAKRKSVFSVFHPFHRYTKKLRCCFYTFPLLRIIYLFHFFHEEGFRTWLILSTFPFQRLPCLWIFYIYIFYRFCCPWPASLKNVNQDPMTFFIW